MPHVDHAFRLTLQQVDAEGWYALAGTWHGPFATPEAMERDVLAVLAAWRERAEALGGWAWRRTATEIVVTLPEGVQVEGGDPLTPWVRKV